MTYDDVAKLLAMLHAAWQNAKVADHDAQVRAYEIALHDIPYEAGEQAVRSLIQEAEFFPPPAKIRKAALSILGVIMSPEEAWREVVRQIREVGFYGSPSFSNPLIAETVRHMGWRNLCGSDDLDADRAWFIRVFESLQRQAITSTQTLPSGRASQARPVGGGDSWLDSILPELPD
jgi:hypothetical protein